MPALAYASHGALTKCATMTAKTIGVRATAVFVGIVPIKFHERMGSIDRTRRSQFLAARLCGT